MRDETVFRSGVLRLEAALLDDRMTTFVLSAGPPPFFRIELPGPARDSLRTGDMLRIMIIRADS